MLTNLSMSKLKILSGSVLKSIAVISMFIDHAAAILAPVVSGMRIPFSLGGKVMTVYWIMRKTGRLAFPIFCFLIAEGYAHTKNKKQYGLRMLIFALISEIPFNLLHSNVFFNPDAQNVYFTLLMGFLLIHAFEVIRGQLKKFLVISAIAVLAVLLKSDYGLNGALLVFSIYLFRSTPAVQVLFSYPLLSRELCAVAAFIPINLYNGKRGFIKTPLLKYAFYVFYPLHILVLVGIRYIIA